MQGGDREGGSAGDRHARYALAFDRFFARPNLASTYKPVLASALVDAGRWEGDHRLAGRQWICAEDDGRISVGLDFVAVRFAKFYWDMVAGFDARHMPERMADPDDPAMDTLNIVKAINAEIKGWEEAEIQRAAASAGPDPGAVSRAAAEAARRVRAGFKPPTLERLASDDMAPFRQRVVARAIKPEVLRHLHDDMPELYDIVRGENRIVLDREAVEYMGRYEATLRLALSQLIARHLEEVNPSMRHVAAKTRLGAPYEDRLKDVMRLEARAMEQKADIDRLCSISSDLTAGLERLAALRT